MVRPVIEEHGNWSSRQKYEMFLRTWSWSSRQKYEMFLPDEKAKIGKKAAECCVLSTICHFSMIYPDCALNE